MRVGEREREREGEGEGGRKGGICKHNILFLVSILHAWPHD